MLYEVITIPKVNCYHWNDWDFQWSVEACIDAREGFHDVIRFMENPTLEKSGMLSPKEYTQQIASGSTQGITPFQVAAALRCDAGNTLNTVTLLRKKTNQPELCTLLDDLDATANLGNYYAAKIEAATELALFLETHDPEYQQKSVELLTEAAGHWKNGVGAWGVGQMPDAGVRTLAGEAHAVDHALVIHQAEDARFGVARITSYNVCYTKLLRDSGIRFPVSGCFG